MLLLAKFEIAIHRVQNIVRSCSCRDRVRVKLDRVRVTLDRVRKIVKEDCKKTEMGSCFSKQKTKEGESSLFSFFC